MSYIMCLSEHLKLSCGRKIIQTSGDLSAPSGADSHHSCPPLLLLNATIFPATGSLQQHQIKHQHKF